MTRKKSFLENENVQAIASQLMETEQGQRLMGQAVSVLSRFNEVVDKIAKGELPQPGQVKGVSKGAARVVERIIKRGPTAREILHFAPGEPLTIEKVKTRKKDLARFIHPDAGGAGDEMVKINTAADALLKELK